MDDIIKEVRARHIGLTQAPLHETDLELDKIYAKLHGVFGWQLAK